LRKRVSAEDPLDYCQASATYIGLQKTGGLFRLLH